MVLSLIALVLVPLGLFVPEHDHQVWDDSEAWAVFALACAVVQLAPLLRSMFAWSAERAWVIGAVGAGGLLLYWVLLVLPSISANTSFALTAATAAACGGLWLAPGRRL
jgi:hypothetical protein